MRKFSPMKSLQNKLGGISRRTKAADFLRSNIVEKKLNAGVSIQKVILVSFVLAAALFGGFFYKSQVGHVQAAVHSCAWTGAVSADWNNPANWTNCGTTAPQEVDNVLIQTYNAASNPVSITTAITVNNFTIEDFYTGTVTVAPGLTITITGNYLQYAGVFIAPSGGNLRIGGDFVNYDTFTGQTDFFNANSGTVTLYNATSADANVGGSTKFYNLVITSSVARTINFQSYSPVGLVSYPQIVLNNFVANGSAGNLLTLGRLGGASGYRWTLDLRGPAPSVSYLVVKDSYNLRWSTDGIYLNPANSVNGKNNVGWFNPITISGKCNSTNETIRVAIDGVLATEAAAGYYFSNPPALAAVTTITNGQCSYTISGVDRPAAGDSVIVFVDRYSGVAPTSAQRAVSAMKYNTPGSNITGFDMQLRTLSIGSDDSMPVYNSDLSDYDSASSGNLGIFYDVSGSNNLALPWSGTDDLKLYIRNGCTYQPSPTGQVTSTMYYLEIAAGGTLLGDNNIIVLNGNTPFTNSGTFSVGTSTVRYMAPTTVTATDYYNLELLGYSGNTTLAAGTFNVGNNFIVGNGTAITNVLANTNNPTLNLMNFNILANSSFTASATAVMNVGGDFTSSGLFTHSSGTVTLTADKIVAFVKITNAGTKFYNLTVSKTKAIDGNIDIYNNIVVEKDLVFQNLTNNNYISFRKDYSTSTAVVSVAGNVSFPSTSSNTGKVYLGNYAGTDETYTPTIDFKGNFNMAEGNVDYQTPSVLSRANFIASGSVDQRFSRLRETSAYLVGQSAPQSSYLAGDFTKSNWKFSLASGKSIIPDSDFIFDNVTCDASYSANFARNGNYKTVLDGFAYNTGCETKFVQPLEPISPEPAYDHTGYVWFGDFTMNAANKTLLIDPNFKTQFGFLRSKFSYVVGGAYETWVSGVTTINNGTLAFPDDYLVSIGSIALNVGNLNAPSLSGVITMYGDFARLSSATFNAGTGRTIADLRYGNINIAANGGQAFYNFDILNAGIDTSDRFGNRVLKFNDNLTIANDVTIENTILDQYCGYYNGHTLGTTSLLSGNGSATLTVNGNFNYPDTTSVCSTLTGSNVSEQNFSLNLKGDLNLEDSNNTIFGGGDAFYANVNLIGNKTQHINKTDKIIRTQKGQWTVDKDSSTDQVVLDANFSSSTDLPINFTVNKGTFDLNGKNFIVWGNTSIHDNGTLRLVGTETTPLAINFSRFSTTEYYGVVAGLEIKNYNYGNLTINSTDGTNTGTYALPSFLAGYWKMDESSWAGLGAVKDSSGLGNDATALGNTTPVTDGKYNNAASFTRTATDTTSSYINAGTLSNTDLTGEVTISTWVKFNSAPDCRTAQGFVSKGDGLKLYSGCNFGASDPKRYVAFEAAGAVASFPLEPVVGTWYHLVGVYKQYDSAKLYVDGVPQKTAPLAGIKRTENTNFIKIGSSYSERIDCVAAGYSQCSVWNSIETFDGKMDEVRLYNKALTDAQITDLYTNNANTAQYKTNVQNDLLIKAGTLDGRSRSISVGGNWTNQGTFMSKDGNVTFNSTDKNDFVNPIGTPITAIKLINNNNQNFGNLTFDSDPDTNGAYNGQWQFTDNQINLQNSLYVNHSDVTNLGVNLNNKVTNIAGNVVLAGGKLTAGNSTIYVAGDWTNTGGASVLSYNTSTVNLNKADGPQKISGDTTFYNLAKQVATEQHLVFAKDSNTQVKGIWTATGATAGTLFIEGEVAGSQWNISLNDTSALGRNLNYLAVRDSYNKSLVGGVISKIDVSTLTVFDLGSNTNWIFGARSISGTCYTYDELDSSPCAAASNIVTVAINNNIQSVKGNVGADGKWSVPLVGVNAGDTITIYLAGVTPMGRANLVTVFNNTDILNAQLFEDHLTIGASSSQTVTNKLIAQASNLSTLSSDIIFTVDSARYVLNVVNQGDLNHKEVLFVGKSGVYQPKANTSTAASTTAPNIHITSTGNLSFANCTASDTCTITVNGGDWINSPTGMFASGNSTVNFLGNATDRKIQTGNEGSKFDKTVINGNVSETPWVSPDTNGNPYQYQKAITVAGPYYGVANPGDSLKNGLTSEYKMDEAALTPTGSVADSGTNNLPATNSNATISTDGKFGNVATFDASKNSYIAMPVAATSSLGKNFTISMWVNTIQSTTGTYDPTLFGVKTSSAAYPYLNVSVKNGRLGMTSNMSGGNKSTFTEDNPNSSSGNYNVADGQWYHVVVVADGSKVALYANKGADGKLQYLGSSPVANGLINDASLYLGAVNVPGNSFPVLSCFTGKMDDVRIYNRALSSTELGVLDQANQDSYFDTSKTSTYQTVLDDAEALRYTFEDTILGTDASGNGNTAAINGPTKTTGKFDSSVGLGSGLKFANAGDYVNIPNKIIPGPGSEFSTSMWFYQELAGTAPQIFMGESSQTDGFYFGTANGGASPNYDDIQFGNWITNVGTWAVGPGQWHHVVGVSRKDGADLYFDGVKYSTGTPLSYANNPDSFVLGRKNATLPDGQFRGALDEVRVYNRALSAADVSSLNVKNVTSDWAGIYAKAQLDGTDIIFTDSNNSPLSFYRDKFTSTGQNARFVVNVPDLAADASKTIYMYYGNSHTDKSNATNTFESSNNVNLKAAWSFDDNLGTTAKDMTVNTNTCTFGSTRGDAIYWSSLGKFNSSFDAWNYPSPGAQNYMDCGNKSAISNISGAITLEAWVKNDSAATSSGDIISKTYDAAVNSKNAYALGVEYVYNGTYSVPKYKFRIYTGSAWVTLYSDFSAKTDQWQHVVATWNNTDKLMKLYIDGALQPTTQSFTGSALQNTTSSLMIGRDGDSWNRFTGEIDEPRVYDSALSAAQIATNATSKPFYANNSVYMTNFANGVIPKVTFTTGDITYIPPSKGTWAIADDFYANSLTVGDGGLNASAFNMTLAGDFTQKTNSSTSLFTAPSADKTMSIAGNFTHTSGTFTPGTGTVLFNSKSTDIKNISLNSGINLNNLTFDSGITGRGQWKFADSMINVLGDFKIGNTVTKLADIPPIIISTPYVWVPNSSAGTVSKIDSVTGLKIADISVGGTPNSVAVDSNGSAWITNASGNYVTRILGDGSKQNFTTSTAPNGVAIDKDGFVWVTSIISPSVQKLNPITGAVVSSYSIGLNLRGITADSLGNVWVTSSSENRVYRISPLGIVSNFATGSSPQGLAIDSNGFVWVANYADKTVSKIDPSSGTKVTVIVGDSPRGVAVGADGNVYVANSSSTAGNTISKLDSNTNVKITDIPVCTGPVGVSASGDGFIWASCANSNKISKINLTDSTRVDIATGANPAFMGDMTGFALQKFVLKSDVVTAVGLDLQGKSLNVAKNFTIDGAGGRITVSDISSIKVAGDWINGNGGGNTFKNAADSASPAWTAELNGAAGSTQKVLGSNDFYNLVIKNMSSNARTIEFEAAKLTTINKKLDIEGNSYEYKSIILKSTLDNSKWNIKLDSLATSNVDSVLLYDSNNATSVLLCASNSNGAAVDSGSQFNKGWIISRNKTTDMFICPLPITIVLATSKTRVATTDSFQVDLTAKNATFCSLTSSPANSTWTSDNNLTGTDTTEWTHNVSGLKIENTTNFMVHCTRDADFEDESITVSVNGGICTFNDKNTIQAYVFCENAFNLNGNNSTFNGSVSSKNMSIGNDSSNNRFNYGYDVDGAAPPGFKYLNIPNPSEVGNKQ